MTAGVTAERVAEFETLVEQVRSWAGQQADVVAVGLAGSWARGVPRMDSDADVIVLTTDPSRYERETGWIAALLGPDTPVVRTARWRRVLERRLLLPSGFEVEVGAAPVDWAAVDPVDAGTARVVTDGFRVLHDPDGVLQRLVEALALDDRNR